MSVLQYRADGRREKVCASIVTSCLPTSQHRLFHAIGGHTDSYLQGSEQKFDNIFVVIDKLERTVISSKSPKLILSSRHGGDRR